MNCTEDNLFQLLTSSTLYSENDMVGFYYRYCEALTTGSDRPRKYWNDLKRKLSEEGYDELSEKIGQLKYSREAASIVKPTVLILKRCCAEIAKAALGLSRVRMRITMRRVMVYGLFHPHIMKQEVK